MAHAEIGQPDRVTIEERTLQDIGPDFRYVFPAHSVTIIEMNV